MYSTSSHSRSRLFVLPVFVLSIVVLFWTSRINYLLFHSMVEIFSIVVAFSLFMIAWNARRYISNSYILFIGMAYLFIGFLDLLHTLSYKGLAIFTDYDFYANQLWIAARFMESLSLLAGFYFLNPRRHLMTLPVLIVYTVVTGLLIASIFTWKIFPVCFVGGQGLTPFKKYSEYVICLILITDIYLLYKNKPRFDDSIYHCLILSLYCTVISELAFTFYIDNFGLFNVIGHFFKLFSFLYVYQSIVKNGIESPYKVIFHDLDIANRNLVHEIDVRKEAEQEKENLIQELTTALDEIKTLKGIVPICMHCKSIRDDKGYWNQLEKFIQDHSDAEFSHGICPQCMKKHYPELK